MKKVAVVCISVDYSNARKVCELIENNTYNDTNACRIDLLEELKSGVESEIEEGILIYNIEDFVTVCNDQELNIEGYFISYVYFLD